MVIIKKEKKRLNAWDHAIVCILSEKVSAAKEFVRTRVGGLAQPLP